MRFTIEVSELEKALAGNIAGRSTSDIYQHVLISVEEASSLLVVRSTNMGMEFAVKVQTGSVEEHGACTTHPLQLKNAISGLQGVVEVSHEDGRLKVTQQAGNGKHRRKISLETLPASDWPSFEASDYVEFVMSDEQRSELISAMRQVQYAMATNDVRYYLNGMLIGQGYVAATDGYRLGAVKISHLPERDLIIPREAISKFISVLDDAGKLNIGANASKVSVVSESLELSASLIDRGYPNIVRLFSADKPLNVTSINKSELIGAMCRAGNLEMRKDDAGIVRAGVRVRHEDGAIRIQGKRIDDFVMCDIEKSDIEVGLDAKYVNDALGSIEGDTVIWERHPNNTHQRFYAPDSEAIHMIMPFKI